MYKTVQGQTWDRIAKEVYGDEMKVTDLFDANPDLLGVFIFSDGQELQTPELMEEEAELPPWRAADE